MWRRSSGRKTKLACSHRHVFILRVHTSNLKLFFLVSFCIRHTHILNIKCLIQGHSSLERSRWKLVLEFKVATSPHQWKQSPAVGLRWKKMNLFQSWLTSAGRSTNGHHSNSRTNSLYVYSFIWTTISVSRCLKPSMKSPASGEAHSHGSVICAASSLAVATAS